MRKIIIAVIVIVVIALCAGLYFLFAHQGGSTGTGSAGGQLGTLPAVGTSTTAGTASNASDVYGVPPTGAQFSIGTPQGTVTVNNFYLANPPVVEGGTIIIKQAQNYAITYDPATSEFWLAITGTPFTTARAAAEQDFLATLGISKADACKLSVTSGIVYSPGDPNDGKSFPLSFCATGAF